MDTAIPPSQHKGKGEKVVRHTFRKKDRLASNIAISQLAKDGKAINHAPFRLIYSLAKADDGQKTPSQVQLAIAVPKRSFKRAVDRNLLKRRIREAYRLNNKGLYERMALLPDLNLRFLLVYVSPEIMPYQRIEEQLIALLGRLLGRIEKAAGASVPPAS